mmetsp:Transcript_30056/g.77139  ORF Transcript_30056/g.77139 Transcript_30056/m.77139 type:complete len:584 (-) Transcript_30056:385-2136(-)|eukprot:jgi/Tetstr1/443264/TSEL_031298.t1
MSEYANPLPPPPRKGLGAEAQKTFGDKQLSNKDFTMLLSTPRPGAKPDMSRSKPPTGSAGVGEDGFAVPKAKAKRRDWRAKKEGEEEEKSDEPLYRDRAKERREGRLVDYELANADLAAMVQGQDVDVSSISVEDSKFLGGDVEHTHLVKGLDYALLNKMRGDQEKEKKKAAEEETEKQPHKPEVKFVSAMGRAVYQAVCEPRRAVPLDSFLPGRTAFLYRLEEDDLGNEPSDMPTTLRRSKADCPKLPPMMLGGVDKQLMERVATIMSYVQLAPGGKKNKIKKKDRMRILGEYADQPAQPAAKPTTFGSLAKPQPQPQSQQPSSKPASAGDDSDDDIFGDAGKDYVCDLVDKPADGDGKHAKGGYFDTADEMDDLPPMQGPARPPAGGAAAYNYDDGDVDMEVDGEDGGAALPPEYADEEEEEAPPAEDQKPRKSAAEQKPELKGFAEEAYAECFPEYYDMAHEVVDSDDEGAANKMDLGQKGGKVKSRYDFSTEEEYNQYKQSQEANPKAAYQFGVKRDGGRKSSSTVAKGKASDSKVNSELSKIKNILHEKGHKKDMVAFQVPEDLPTTGGGGNKRRKRL